MTNLPDGIAKWHEQRGLQILWLLSSIFMVMLDIVGLDVGFLAGLLGIIGSSLAVCNCFQGMDLRSIVKVRTDGGDLARHTLLLACCDLCYCFAGGSDIGLLDFGHFRTHWSPFAQCFEQLGM